MTQGPRLDPTLLLRPDPMVAGAYFVLKVVAGRWEILCYVPRGYL